MMRVFLAALLFCVPVSALAHSWYPNFCCNDKDCEPVACEQIDEDANGATYNGVRFRKDRVFPSQDSKCHACIGKGITGGVGYCIFTQQGY